ncbi:nuclear receptor binding SET domain protein [Arctopsyche grandis]|uniref:nuclear receptor binding SET domain protein n=1 Tax=Arctopsyche grandis TaxID=121162 RepID=UPI00406D81E2
MTIKKGPLCMVENEMDSVDVVNASAELNGSVHLLNGSGDFSNASNQSCSSKTSKSPSLFDDGSPLQNISRYGRNRKQKTITDFLIGSSYDSQKLLMAPVKTMRSVSPKKRSPDKKCSLSPDAFSKLTSTPCSSTSGKGNVKVYVRKDLIQKKNKKEETANLMRSMFSPIKSETSPVKPERSLSPVDKIVLKKSPQGIFQCSPKKSDLSKSNLNFDSEADFTNFENDPLISKIKIENEPEENVNSLFLADELACGWVVGELAWARVGAHPLWPCLITRDPVNDMFVRKKTIGRSVVPSYVMHVTFFADNGRHSWLISNLLMRFNGLDDFNTIKSELTPEMRKKDPKYCAAFEIRQSKQTKWRSAVSEAEMLLRRPPELRENFLFNMLCTTTNSVKKTPKSKNKKEPKIKIENDPNGSLSESLFDSLFSEDVKPIIQENGSLLDRTIHSDCSPKFEKKISQTHMDRWLSKAKAPLKNQLESETVTSPVSDKSKPNNVDSPIPLKKRKNVAKSRDKTLPNNESSSEIEIITKIIIETEDEPVEQDQSISEPLNNNDSELVFPIVPNKRGRKRKADLKIEPKISNDENSDTSDIVKPEKAASDDVPKVTKNGDKYGNPKFQQFLSLKRDSIMDENPALSESDLVSYLYQVWEYGENQMADEMKNSNSVCLVKGMAEDILPPPIKKLRKPHSESRDSSQSPTTGLERYTRKKAVTSYFVGWDSDTADSDSDFDAPLSDKVKIKDVEVKVKENSSSHVDVKEEMVKVDVDEINKALNKSSSTIRSEMYMESLKIVKPNIFKGMSKEKVCEICESPSNLVKCKGPCQRMFHIECVRKELEPEPVPESGGSLLKKRKKRGRPKEEKADSKTNSGTSEDCSDEFEDYRFILNGYGDTSPSPASNEGDDASTNVNSDTIELMDQSVIDFENQMSQKMMELMESESCIDMESSSISSSDDCDWSNIKAGQCVIVDVKITKNKKKDDALEAEIFKCNHCLNFEVPLCFVCKSATQPKTGDEYRQRCNIIHCHQFYHPECLKVWPQTKYSTCTITKAMNKRHTEALSCPRHVCHTCVSDDPQGCKTRFSGDKLAKCVRCPATYHCFTQCVPAGTRLITASQIICPRHNNLKSGRTCHINTAWCFICAKGGTLVCCETCPTSVHAECLNVPLPEGGYICEDCETGRLPLYEELVWVKLGHYRWWPALVLHPVDIPPNIKALPHEPGQFAVRFFGIYDHYWINGGRVFPYQEGDTGHASGRKSAVDNAFVTAVKQAQEAFAIIKSFKGRGPGDSELSSSLLPPKYVKLKVNRAIGGAIATSKLGAKGGVSRCDCDPSSEKPCAPDTDCLNRMLLTECSPSVCSAGERCGNQAFEKRLYPPLEPSRTSYRGWGLKALVDIKKGDFVIEYVGEVIDETEFQRRMTRRQEMRDENYYFLTLDKDRMIDAGPKGNVARFMNHSCEPNCETQKWTVNGDTRVGLFALKDVEAGSEVTFNYNLACAGDDKKKCLCGTKRCAGYIGAKPKQEEVVPKKPRLKHLKRKYKRRISNSPVATTSKATPRLNKSLIEKEVEVAPEPEGIDLDVAIINKAVSELEARSSLDSFESFVALNGSSSMQKFDDCETIESEGSPASASAKKAFENKNGKVIGKRKRLSLQLSTKTKSQPAPNEVSGVKRSRSNSVQFSDSVTVIDGNDEVRFGRSSALKCDERKDIPVSEQNGFSESKKPFKSGGEDIRNHFKPEI